MTDFKERDFNTIFAYNLNKLLSVHDMSQKDLADRLGVSAQSVSNWCSGKKTPRMDKVDRICSIFGIKREALTSDPEEEKKELPESSSSGISDTVKKLYPQLTQDEQHLVDEMIISLARKKG